MTHEPPLSTGSRLLLQKLHQSIARIAAERLEALPPRGFVIAQANPDTNADECEVTMWAEANDEGLPLLTLYLGPGYGRQARYLELTPPEARKLIAMLTELCAQVEDIANAKP